MKKNCNAHLFGPVCHLGVDKRRTSSLCLAPSLALSLKDKPNCGIYISVQEVLSRARHFAMLFVILRDDDDDAESDHIHRKCY
mmetsp:Transcript_2477/g.3069  ORF Transcript_2477/g.3069 Transcript_2477/m.3069 type:complete len:83 (+) Transcript_2477:55-303(+)